MWWDESTLMLHSLSLPVRIGRVRFVALVASAAIIVLVAACSGPTPQSGAAVVNLADAAESAVAPVDTPASETDAAPVESAPADAVGDAAPVAADDSAVADADPADTGASADVPVPAADDVRPLDATTNILVLGSDRRPDTPNWRTDVMMIIAMDQEHGRAGVISLPRDVYVDAIPNHQPNRMNVIDYLGEQDEPDGGGPALLGSIIEERMGVHIDHYVRFDFDSFRDVVDALGGVELDVDCEFRGYVEEDGGWLVLPPGPNRLTGDQALIYVRDRQLTGGDLQRARRQQRFVWAVRNQVLSENLITRLPALYSALSGAIDTDLGLIRTLQLARFAVGLGADDLYGMVVGPPDMLQEGWRDGMAVFVPDWPLIAENVQQVFTHEPFMIDNTPVECRP